MNTIRDQIYTFLSIFFLFIISYFALFSMLDSSNGFKLIVDTFSIA